MPSNNLPSNKEDVLSWLKENDLKKLSVLRQMADCVRKNTVGDEVHLRGLLEISNYCSRECSYCGIHLSNKNIQRYRMTAAEIIDGVKNAESLGYGTVVMQAGEDNGLEAEWISTIIKIIKNETSLAVTLSLGERCDKELQLWKKAGADRYLLRFETTDLKLYHAIHPQRNKTKKHEIAEHPRIEILKSLRQMGYEIGSGVMIGIPGQTYDILATDILTFKELDLDMIGVGPYIKHPETSLAINPIKIDQTVQVPNTELMTYKTIALARIICPEANIPATTALATLNKAFGRESGLLYGANVVMPNITPLEYREKYEIYPGKACINETAEQCQKCMKNRIAMVGRTIGKEQGGRKRRSCITQSL